MDSNSATMDMMRATVEDLNALYRQKKMSAAKVFASAPIASEARLASALFEDNVRDLFYFYQMFNGQRHSSVCLIDDWNLFDITTVVTQHLSTLNSYFKGRITDEFIHLWDYESTGPIKDVFWSPLWIPIGSNSGRGRIYVDLDPDLKKGGHKGQVFAWYGDSSHIYLAPSFWMWLNYIIGDLAANRRYQDEDGRVVWRPDATLDSVFDEPYRP